MAEKKSFVLFAKSEKLVSKLTDEQAGLLFKAIFRYVAGGDLPEMDIATELVFTAIQDYLDENNEKYANRVNANRENGKKGGRPKTQKDNFENPKNPKNPDGFFENPKNLESDSESVSVSDTVSDTVSDSPNGEYINPVSSNEDTSSAKPTRDATPYQQVVDSFNEICLSLPKVQKITRERRQSIRGRCKEYSLNEINDVFRRAEKSDFLSGRNGNWNGCSFDWLMKPSNFLKVLEGNYENQPVFSQPSKINGHDELDEFYKMTARWAEGDSGG